MSDIARDTFNTVTNTAESGLRNDYVFAVLAIIAFAYGRYAAPRLPDWLVTILSNDIFRVLLLSLLLIIRFESRPTVAIIVALSFVVIFDIVLREKTLQHFENMDGNLVDWIDQRIDNSEKLGEALHNVMDKVDDKKLEDIVNRIKTQNGIMS